MELKNILSTIWNFIRTTLVDYSVVTFGTILYCVGWTSFLIPGGIASGGGTGLCTIFYYATGIPVSYSFIVLNIFLLTIGFLILGKGFGFKTIYVILLSTVLFYFLDPGIFPNAGKLVVSFDDKLITSIVGGLVEAIGISIVLMRGGSTGGTDILAMVVSKYWPVSPGKVYLYADLFIIASVLFIPGKTVNDMVYGYVVMVTFSFTVDAMLMGRKSSVQLMVFSSKYKEIADYITDHKKRGVTALDSVGWYTGQEGKVLLIICYKLQMQDFINTIKEIDPKAFVSVSSTAGVFGEGFEEVKTGLKRKNKNKSIEEAKKSI